MNMHPAFAELPGGEKRGSKEVPGATPTKLGSGKPLPAPGFEPGDRLRGVRGMAPGHGLLIDRVENFLARACAKHLSDDHVQLAASLYPLPTDTGLEPAVCLYVMLPGYGDEPGQHMIQFETPYGLSQEIVDLYVKDLADRTADERQRLRQAREQGKPETQGLALGLGTV